MLFNLPEQLTWRQFGRHMFVLELLPDRFIVGGVELCRNGKWRTTVAQHREGPKQLRAPAGSQRQAQYFVERWTASNLSAIQEECRARAACTWGMRIPGVDRPLPPGFNPSTVPARQKRRSRRSFPKP